MAIWHQILDVFEASLKGLHDLFEGFAGVHSWGWAIIALTLIVRILLLPLAIKQIRSMRAMQAIQPKIQEIQKKHKVDRELMKKDPEQYKAKKQKLNEEMMALYQSEGVNPAASCLPLLAQAPVFFALFNILRGQRASELANEPFYFFTSYISDDSDLGGLGAIVNQAGWPGWLLIVLMAATMFISQKQVMARQTANGDSNPMAQQQKVLLYVMPVFLGFISLQLPLGVLLYWVTTNLWQAGQQWLMLREVKHEAEEGTLAEHKGGEAAARFKPKKKPTSGPKPRKSPGASSGTKPVTGTNGKAKPPKGDGGNGAGPAKPKGGGRKRDHLPRRGEHT